MAQRNESILLFPAGSTVRHYAAAFMQTQIHYPGLSPSSVARLCTHNWWYILCLVSEALDDVESDLFSKTNTYCSLSSEGSGLLVCPHVERKESSPLTALIVNKLLFSGNRLMKSRPIHPAQFTANLNSSPPPVFFLLFIHLSYTLV